MRLSARNVRNPDDFSRYRCVAQVCKIPKISGRIENFERSGRVFENFGIHNRIDIFPVPAHLRSTFERTATKNRIPRTRSTVIDEDRAMRSTTTGKRSRYRSRSPRLGIQNASDRIFARSFELRHETVSWPAGTVLRFLFSSCREGSLAGPPFARLNSDVNSSPRLTEPNRTGPERHGTRWTFFLSSSFFLPSSSSLLLTPEQNIGFVSDNREDRNAISRVKANRHCTLKETKARQFLLALLTFCPGFVILRHRLSTILHSFLSRTKTRWTVQCFLFSKYKRF